MLVQASKIEQISQIIWQHSMKMKASLGIFIYKLLDDEKKELYGVGSLYDDEFLINFYNDQIKDIKLRWARSLSFVAIKFRSVN